MDDRAVVAVQIEREPRSEIDVSARCHLQIPVVISVPPHLDDGTPFPTRYWLTCPLAVRRIGRLESTGGVKAAEARLEVSPELSARHLATMERYRADREELINNALEGPRPSGGVGGAATGVKCLHAHYADFAVGNDNVVGEWTASDIEPLNCSVACVAPSDDGVGRNPDWREPSR